MGPKGIPYIVTHDGRTIRFPNPKIKKNDTIKLDLKNNSILDHYKFHTGSYVMISKGNNIGRVGKIERIEKHEGSYEIIHVVDNNGLKFCTRLQNVFVTGEKHHEIQLPKRVSRLTIIQERDVKAGRRVEVGEEAA